MKFEFINRSWHGYPACSTKVSAGKDFKFWFDEKKTPEHPGRYIEFDKYIETKSVYGGSGHTGKE